LFCPIIKDTLKGKESIYPRKTTNPKIKQAELKPVEEESDWNINTLVQLIKREKIKGKINDIPAPLFVSQISLAMPLNVSRIQLPLLFQMF